MENQWYPTSKKELNNLLDSLLKQKVNIKPKNIHGLIVPHAGYEYSGKIAGKAFALIKNKKFTKAVVIGPSHYQAFYGIASLDTITTPLGNEEIIKNSIPKLNTFEHSITNQIPFLQKIGINKILPVVVGEISDDNAKVLSEQILKEIDNKTILITSTDLSHFLPYDEALKKDKNTIKIIESLDTNRLDGLDACGQNPLKLLIPLCKSKNYTPKLIEYKNSGDITGDKSSVVGYASFYF